MKDEKNVYSQHWDTELWVREIEKKYGSVKASGVFRGQQQLREDSTLDARAIN